MVATKDNVTRARSSFPNWSPVELLWCATACIEASLNSGVSKVSTLESYAVDAYRRVSKKTLVANGLPVECDVAWNSSKKHAGVDWSIVRAVDVRCSQSCATHPYFWEKFNGKNGIRYWVWNIAIPCWKRVLKRGLTGTNPFLPVAPLTTAHMALPHTALRLRDPTTLQATPRP